MTEIEKKALALVNEVSDGFHDVTSIYDIHTAKSLRSALCRAIEQHEAFRQEVSDAVDADVAKQIAHGIEPKFRTNSVRFILPKPVDPLVEAVKDCQFASLDAIEDYVAKKLRAAIEKRGGKIVWGEG